MAGPVHLDELRPRFEPEVHALPPTPPGRRLGQGQPHRPGDHRVQPVASDQPVGPEPRGRDAVGILDHLGDPAGDDPRAELQRALAERGVQGRAPHPERVPAGEAVACAAATVAVVDADQRESGGRDPESLERGQRAGHEPLAAGLVDHALARLDDDHVEPGQPGLDRGRETDRPAARDEHLGLDRCRHAAPSSRRLQRAILRRDPEAEQQDRVEHREDERGDPRRVDERERDALDRDEHVVRMPQPASSGTDRGATAACPARR